MFFSDADYATLGTRIKCNPAVKTLADRDALRRALSDGRISVIGTDHAPHQWADKQGGCARAVSVFIVPCAGQKEQAARRSVSGRPEKYSLGEKTLRPAALRSNRRAPQRSVGPSPAAGPRTKG